LIVQEALAVNHLTARNGGQQLPKLAPIHQGRELASDGAVAKAVHNAQRDVFLVGHPTRSRAEPSAGQLDQLAIVPLPQKASGVFIAGLESPKPVRDRLVTGHDRPPAEKAN
jgi:hypothetical protein